MKKRTRFFIFIICILFGVYFLIPTLKWYFVFNENDKNQARLEGDRLKFAVRDDSFAAVRKLNDGVKLSGEEKALALEVIKEVKVFNRINPTEKINFTKNADYKQSMDTLMKLKGKEDAVNSFVLGVFEDYYKSTYKEKKSVKDNIIKLGLDLQGGAYAVVTVNFNDPKVQERLKQMVSEEEKTNKKNNTNAKYEENLVQKYKASMLDSAVLKIENRINKYGVSETSIQKLSGMDKIIISMPGVKDISELRQIIETVGVLEFKLVSEEATSALYSLKAEADKTGAKIFDANWKLLPEYQSRIDSLVPNTESLLSSNKDKWGDEGTQREVLMVYKEPLLGGSPEITSASVDTGETGKYVVNFVLSDKDAKGWAKATEENVKKRVAIVLDNVILQAPTVNEKIPNGRSQITLGNAPLEELNNLALILRSGSLSVPLEISEEHTVGASMGQDTIQKGMMALLLGTMFVIAFMIIWYSVGGVIADIAVGLNILLLISGLALFKGTLTMPGIAGILLTIGMAVDSNVIIYERIKEEYRSGKTFKTSVYLGFNRAFWTIMDANLTTFIAGIGLSIFGTGPLKGFAVTLCLGIVTTLFTALFVSRLVFDSLLSVKEFKSLRFLSLLRGK